MLNPREIVIVTEEMDFHADAVILKLREMGHEPVRLHTADIPIQTTLEFSFDGTDWDGSIYLHANERMIDLEDIRSIWWRRPSSYTLPADFSEEEQGFAREELSHALQGLWASLDCYWMSFPPDIRLASWKPAQLKRAAALGFEVPRTLIATNPEAVRAFYEVCEGNIIYKTFSSPMLGRRDATIVYSDGDSRSQAEQERPPVRAVYTTPIKAEHLEMLEGIRFAPCLFQEYVPKQVELRVTVIGDEIFTAQIDSQAQERTRYDWRHYDVPMLVRKGSLPVDVAERCYKLAKSYDLNFSTMDLILTPDGRYVFIENNPNGQWLWVQELAPELKMLEALVDCLIRGKSPA